MGRAGFGPVGTEYNTPAVLWTGGDARPSGTAADPDPAGCVGVAR